MRCDELNSSAMSRKTDRVFETKVTHVDHASGSNLRMREVMFNTFECLGQTGRLLGWSKRGS